MTDSELATWVGMEGAARSAKADPSSTEASTASEERSVGPPSQASGGFPFFDT